MITVRKGDAKDIPSIFGLIQELALFEKALGEVINTPEKMYKEIFGNNPACRILVAEENEEILGAAVYFFSYSTWKGRSMYLDDIIVTGRHRGRGIGKKLFDALVQDAKDENVAKLHWQVLDWNEPAIRFYRKMSASTESGWLNTKLEGDSLQSYSFG